MSFDVTTKYQWKGKMFHLRSSRVWFCWIDLPASVGWSDAELKRSKDAISSLSLKVKRSNVLQQTRRKPRAVNSFCWVGVAALQYELLAENARSTNVDRVAQASDSGKKVRRWSQKRESRIRFQKMNSQSYRQVFNQSTSSFRSTRIGLGLFRQARRILNWYSNQRLTILRQFDSPS